MRTGPPAKGRRLLSDGNGEGAPWCQRCTVTPCMWCHGTYSVINVHAYGVIIACSGYTSTFAMHYSLRDANPMPCINPSGNSV